MKHVCLLVLCIVLSLSLTVAQPTGSSRIELVESIPIETVLDNPDIRNTQEVWLQMIDAARGSLDIEQFYISNKVHEPLEPIIQAIERAAQRGVRVRLIVDARFSRTYPETIDRL